MSNAGVKINYKMWALGTNLDTTQLSSLEMEESSHFLIMLYNLTLVAGWACDIVEIVA